MKLNLKNFSGIREGKKYRLYPEITKSGFIVLTFHILSSSGIFKPVNALVEDGSKDYEKALLKLNERTVGNWGIEILDVSDMEVKDAEILS